MVFNAGIWPHYLNETSLTGIQQALEESGMQEIYKTTTKRVEETDASVVLPHDEMACHIFPCLYLNWTAQLTQESYFDRFHFTSILYQRMNEQLLSLVHEPDSKEQTSVS